MSRSAAAIAAALLAGLPLQDAQAVGTETLANLAIVDLAPEDLARRKIERIDMGELETPTGKIVATDPLVLPERAPFEREVPTGRHPVTLFKAQGRIALAALRLAPGKVARWEIATVPGQDARTLKDDEIFGFGVDAGLGSFMDAAASAAMKKRGDQLPGDGNYYDDVLADELPGGGGDYVMHRPLPDDRVNVAIFSSGWGDGFYASYWGFDAQGRALVLATDYQVLENGDGRSDFDRRHEAALAAMTPEQQDHSREAYEALKRDDVDRLGAMLSRGQIAPDAYVAEAGGSFILEAIRLDRPQALERLVRYGARLELDAATAEDFGVKTYPDYARLLDTPPKPEIAAALPKDFKRRPPNSAALKDVVARWEAGAISLAPDMPKRGPADPPAADAPRP